jgi:putative membrane protein
MMDGYGMGAGGWIFMFLFWALLIGLVVWAVVRIFPSRQAGDAPATHVAPPRAETAKEILDRRLAKSEIDAETYDEIASRLGDGKTGREQVR